ncbi:helix-turn-helix domain-containing protein [Arsenophonus nasoniae]|uniref:Helix-turn-helix transcriptional regulator n=1 Tax=Arsenophonus nasoniae TaxID=638 RepID=A0AA95GS95_9GAMM|nr:helix-turn-helix transcriptional regulator [Arsenophonus nasoniae]WGM03943.1 helix-turn-helix transcriptional regulator [Arsenophonus nasoniae]WGM09140.1 helix-turn-helix transcriptional regulator [Arsenophonus nasoniae]
MKTLAERIKFILKEKDINQVEAARLCGVHQQSISHIIRSNLKESKLSPRIADGLNVNPEWLIYGKGTYKRSVIIRIPLFNNNVEILNYIKNDNIDNEDNYFLINYPLKGKPFAYQLSQKEIIICGQICNNEKLKVLKNEYIYLTLEEVIISKEIPENFPFIFQIYERCIKNVIF